MNDGQYPSGGSDAGVPQRDRRAIGDRRQSSRLGAASADPTLDAEGFTRLLSSFGRPLTPDTIAPLLDELASSAALVLDADVVVTRWYDRARAQLVLHRVHGASLNDVIAQIAHVRVRETVPDAIFDRADSVELVDLTPDDLIQRLKDGKVYIPSQAKRALEHFFSPANLTALRELALRRTAERVDDQLLTEMQARAISGPWAAGERILVCVGEDPRAATLVRYAKRMADRLHGPFTALHVESARSAQSSAVRSGLIEFNVQRESSLCDVLSDVGASLGTPVRAASGSDPDVPRDAPTSGESMAHLSASLPSG